MEEERNSTYEGRPKGLKRILFDLTHPISLIYDIGLTELTKEEIEQYYIKKYQRNK